MSLEKKGGLFYILIGIVLLFTFLLIITTVNKQGKVAIHRNQENTLSEFLLTGYGECLKYGEYCEEHEDCCSGLICTDFFDRNSWTCRVGVCYEPPDPTGSCPTGYSSECADVVCWDETCDAPECDYYPRFIEDTGYCDDESNEEGNETCDGNGCCVLIDS